MSIPDEENLFRFIPFKDYDANEKMIRSTLFLTGRPVSVNRASIWSLEKHQEIIPERIPEYGLCSLTAGEVRQQATKDTILDVNPNPIQAPDLDPLLQIENPSHADFSRILNGGEAKRVKKIATQHIHIHPPVPEEEIQEEISD